MVNMEISYHEILLYDLESLRISRIMKHTIVGGMSEMDEFCEIFNDQLRRMSKSASDSIAMEILLND